jgi:hypothetical protein
MVRLLGRAWRVLPLALLLYTGCMHGGEPARKAPATPLGKLNARFHADYDRVRAAHVERLKAGPVLWMRGTQLIIQNQHTEQKHSVAGGTYHALKSISHAPFLLIVTLLGNEGPSLTETSRESLVHQRQLIADVLAALASAQPERRPPVPAELRQQELALLNATAALIDEVLTSGLPSRERLESFAVEVRPTISANLRAAAREALGNLHRRVMQFRSEIGEEQWSHVRVVISVAHQARARETSVQYFERLLGERMGEGASMEDRLVVSEDFDRGGALELLATHVLDQEAGAILMGDPKRLQSDLLSEAAAEVLEELLPRPAAALRH